MNLTAEQVKNLNILADFMDGLDDPKFTMGQFRHECGTPACAYGWACEVPELKKIGLGTDESARRILGIDGVDGEVYRELFHSSLKTEIRTPQQWAAHCRAFLKSNGYEVSYGFKTFMDRVLIPVDTTETGVAVKSK